MKKIFEASIKKQMHIYTVDSPDERGRQLLIVLAIACLIAMIYSLSYISFPTKEYYSILYLRPDSYNNYLTGDEIAFTYGVKCLEEAETNYNVEILLGDKQIKKDSFTLTPASPNYEKNVTYHIDSDSLNPPINVSVRLQTSQKRYEVGYSIKGIK